MRKLTALATLLTMAVNVSGCGGLDFDTDTEPEATATVTSALPTDGLHGFMIVLDKDVGLAVAAYGGAVNGGPVRALRGCTWENPDCTWTYRNGAIISDRDPALGLRPEAIYEGVKVKLSRTCGSSIGLPPKECQWIYRNGRFISEMNTSTFFGLGIPDAHDRPIGDAQDVELRTTCVTGAEDGCVWNVQGAMLSVRGDTSLSMMAWSDAAHSNTVRLSNNCTRDNPKCTWSFRRGMIISDNNPTLAINAWGGAAVGTEMKLHNGCSDHNNDCVWTMRKGVLISGPGINLTNNLVMSAPTLAHGNTIRLKQGCPPTDPRQDTGPDCSYSVRTAGPQCGHHGQHACNGVTCFEGRFVPQAQKCVYPLSRSYRCSLPEASSVTAAVNVGVSNTGDWSFQGHAHNSAFLGKAYSLGFMFKFADEPTNKQLGYAETGTLGGTLDAESRSDDFVKHGNDPTLNFGWETWAAKGIDCKLKAGVDPWLTVQAALFGLGFAIIGVVGVLAGTNSDQCYWDPNRPGTYTCPIE